MRSSGSPPRTIEAGAASPDAGAQCEVNPMIVRIDHVQLAAPMGCEVAAREFYGSILGLAEIDKPPSLRARGGCWFQCGAQQIHIGVEPDFRPAKKAHPAFAVSDLG